MSLTGEEKENHLRNWIRKADRVVVAFSGGLDSAVLWRVAAEELGERALAVLLAGPSLPSRDLRDAYRIAEIIGGRFRVLEAKEFEDNRYLANDSDRCYWCRASLVETLKPLAEAEGAHLIYGGVTDDLADDRPGMRALAEGGAEAPLLLAGFSKAEVRFLAQKLGIPVWDKPASACLSSRIPTGTSIDPSRLSMVDQAEEGLRGLGLKQVRVRDHSSFARVELGPEGWEILKDDQRRGEILQIIKAAGFQRVAIDLEGYRPAGLKTLPPVGGTEPLPDQVKGEHGQKKEQTGEGGQPPG